MFHEGDNSQRNKSRLINASNGKDDKSVKKNFCTRKFVEFCRRTDLHGYKYIVMEGISTFERCCWAISVAVSIVCAAYFVVTAYRWYARNPIVTVIESTQGAIWDVPFPAVTICDLNLVSKKAAHRFAENLTLPGDVTLDFILNTIKFAPTLHSSYGADPEQRKKLYKLQSVLDLNQIAIEEMYRRISPAYRCDNIIQRCLWKNTIYRCDQLFQPVFTVLNLCCTFNYFAVEEKTKTFKRPNVLVNTPLPRRVASCGYQTALTVLIKTDPLDYYSASVASQGVLVFIDDSYNLPDLDSPVRMVNPSSEVFIALSPERTYSTPGVKGFPPEQRQCYFKDEVKIANFRQYSFHNCIVYRKLKSIKDACNCAPFFLSKDYYRTCNFYDLDCLETVLWPKSIKNHNTTLVDDLHCLPECEHFDYPLEVALGKLASNMHLNRLPFFNEVDLVNQSVLNVFFNDLVSTRYRRDVYLNWQNILAAFGGLLSLMLGFTLISGFDLVIFLVLHVFYGLIQIIFVYKNKYVQKINVQERNSHKEAWIMPRPTDAIDRKTRNDPLYSNIHYY
ncbi:sodium channel protein Nach isoform X2 [Bombyx mori]|uniref:Sodium channel protein Nach n=1 Tax=Bombyx mori TaxID=7091 RepID=A0A8R2R070_BOMMO|nr:sodium channel protein Nach isoform X2 [Bombyx mori]